VPRRPPVSIRLQSFRQQAPDGRKPVGPRKEGDARTVCWANNDARTFSAESQLVALVERHGAGGGGQCPPLVLRAT